MKSTPGFLVIELLVYMTICTMLCMLMMQWVTVHHGAVRAHADRATACLELHAARNLLARDLRGATTRIDEQGAHHYVWNTGSHSVGWEYDNGTLLRSQGSYDYRAHRWIKRTQSLVAKTITRCVLQQSTAGSSLMTAELTNTFGHAVRLCVAARNREVV